MRRAPWLATALLVPLLAVPALPSSGAAPTCLGEEATLVGGPGDYVSGTDGHDVVVADRVDGVDTGAGDDLVCVTGLRTATPTADEVTVDTGAGDDRVEVSVASYSQRVAADLGAGDDSFDSSSGAGRDVVDTGTGADTVFTGAGRDDVLVPGPRPDEPVAPVWIDLGADDDELDLPGNVDLTEARLSGGRGADRLGSYVRDVDWVGVDVVERVVNVDGHIVLGEWEGFEGFSVAFSGSGDTRREAFFQGSPLRDGFAAYGALHVTGATGGGDDVVDVSPAGRADGRIDGGPGRDLVRTDAIFSNQPAIVDLAAGELTRGSRSARTITLLRFDDAAVESDGVVRGDRGANRLYAPCGAAYGGGGDDVVVQTSAITALLARPRVRPALCRFSGGYRAYGGAGDDVLRGSASRDLLVGGAGRDRADGRQGRDTCRTERRVRCEG